MFLLRCRQVGSTLLFGGSRLLGSPARGSRQRLALLGPLGAALGQRQARVVALVLCHQQLRATARQQASQHDDRPVQSRPRDGLQGQQQGAHYVASMNATYFSRLVNRMAGA